MIVENIMTKTKRQWAYFFFLKSERWTKCKIKVLEKHRKKWKKKGFIIPNDSFVCKACKYIFPLSKANFHHISYEAYFTDGWTKPGNIVIVCKECHQKIHK